MNQRLQARGLLGGEPLHTGAAETARGRAIGGDAVLQGPSEILRPRLAPSGQQLPDQLRCHAVVGNSQFGHRDAIGRQSATSACWPRLDQGERDQLLKNQPRAREREVREPGNFLGGSTGPRGSQQFPHAHRLEIAQRVEQAGFRKMKVQILHAAQVCPNRKLVGLSSSHRIVPLGYRSLVEVLSVYTCFGDQQRANCLAHIL